MVMISFVSKDNEGNQNLLLENRQGDVEKTVGARLLAKVVNDDAGISNARGVFEFFASKLAPTLCCGCG
jgi:hypothetical protein